MKGRWIDKSATLPDELKGGTRFELKGGLAVPARPPLIIEPPRNKVGKVNKLRIVKINPYRKQKAIIRIDATMAGVRKAVGSRHVGVHLVCNIDDRFPIHVCCDNALAVGPIWSLKGGLPVRGSAILYTNFGPGPADFPTSVGNDWLEMIVWEPEGVTKAINDPVAFCRNHPDVVAVTNLDGEDLCQECANAWVKGEGAAAAEREAEDPLTYENRRG